MVEQGPVLNKTKKKRPTKVIIVIVGLIITFLILISCLHSYFSGSTFDFVIEDVYLGNLSSDLWDNIYEFSPNGQRFAYTAQDGRREFIVIDGKELPIEGARCLF